MLLIYLVLLCTCTAFAPRYKSVSDTKRHIPGQNIVDTFGVSVRRSNDLHAFVTDVALTSVPILPPNQPLTSLTTEKEPICNNNEFSVVSWNILLPNSKDNWCYHKMYASWVPMEKRMWSHRQLLMQKRLLTSEADIVCIQEAHADTFEKDFAFMKEAGYLHCLHKKFLFRCVTFFKEDKFVLVEEAHKDRTLVTALRCIESGQILNVVNCHLTGGAAPERRLRQVHDALDQIRKWRAKTATTLDKQRRANRPSPKNILKVEASLQRLDDAGVIVCGDFNSDGNTGVRRLLVEGSVDPEWCEPQYPNVSLTSKRKELPLGLRFVDAVELAYASNVCDGDYGEDLTYGCRPATYVVPNIASLLLMPVQGERIPRTQFGPQVARGLATTLGLQAFCEGEIDQAFDSIDLDGNDFIDEDEVQKLLESVYVATHERQIVEERSKFFDGFQGSTADQAGLTRDQFTERLVALQQQLEGSTQGRDFVHNVAKGLAVTLGLRAFCEKEIDRAFDSIDLDDNDFIDEDEVQKLLESVYVATYGRQITEERSKFFDGFQGSTANHAGLTREQFTERLVALQQELEGGSEGTELMEIRTEADAQKMIARFSPMLVCALDHVFDVFSSNDGENLTEEEVAKFLTKSNGSPDRGSTFRYTAAVFTRKMEALEPPVLTREEWYNMFARELAEGKWWQVVYDLEVCGAKLRSLAESEVQHYQGWLDYLYFDSRRLKCTGVQEALSASDQSRIHNDGDALPNEWHPSDHLPVAALFSWKEY